MFIEKPPGITVQQTRGMTRAAEKNSCLTMTGFKRRFVPLSLAARRKVEERGDLLQCLVRFVKSGGNVPYYNGAIDILSCDAVHAVDTLRWIGGEVRKIVSRVDRFYSEIDNAFNALVEFESGAVGMLVTNWMVGKRVFSFEMHARNLSAYVEPDDRAVIYRDNCPEGEVITPNEAAGSDAEHRVKGFFGENRHFIDCIRKGVQPSTSFSDAVKTMELVDRIYHIRM